VCACVRACVCIMDACIGNLVTFSFLQTLSCAAIWIVYFMYLYLHII